MIKKELVIFVLYLVFSIIYNDKQEDIHNVCVLLAILILSLRVEELKSNETNNNR